MSKVEYFDDWLKLSKEMSEEGFTWSMLEEEEEFHQYMSYDIYKMKKETFNKIYTATAKIGNIMNKTYKILMEDNELRKKLNIPKEMDEILKINSNLFSYFTRFDLIVNNGDIKVIETNCDTPTGYLETSVANRIICREKGLESPNELEINIFRTWRILEKEYGIENETVYFTSYGWHEEDRQTVLFNMKWGAVKGRYIPVEDIVVTKDGLFDEDGNKIKFLYRLYPLEYLLEDEVDGVHIGKMFLDNIANGNVTIINPPSSFMMQTKAVMAIIWSFFDEYRTDLFTVEELGDIANYFLPTFFDNRFEGKMKYVKKPVFGREGGGVKIIDEDNNVIEQDKENWYDEWSKIYQQYVEMPEFTLNTWDGEYTGKLLIGSFLIGGEPSGLFLRVGEKITGNLSMFCGITVEE